MTISLLDKSRISEIRTMVQEAGLAYADINEDNNIDFWGMIAEDGTLKGVVGLESYSPRGLLRSLCVKDEMRGTGLGKQLLTRLEDEAKSRDISELYLLTESAASFFEHNGYEHVERMRVPSQIRSTAEFMIHCSEDAVCLFKAI